MRPRETGDIVLVVDDSPDTLRMLTDALEDAGMTVLVALEGAQALAIVAKITPDVILMDAMMPSIDGFETCRRLKRNKTLAHVPVIFMTGLSETQDIVKGLEAGGVDYVTKPIVPDELLARIRALLRRASPERVATVLMIGDLELDREKKRVSRSNRPVDLGPTEFRLLEFLMERPGRVFSREQLLDGVWGSDVYIDERTVDVHVGRLRKALNRGHGIDPIRTVRGAGYSLDDRFGKAS